MIFEIVLPWIKSLDFEGTSLKKMIFLISICCLRLVGHLSGWKCLLRAASSGREQHKQPHAHGVSLLPAQFMDNWSFWKQLNFKTIPNCNSLFNSQSECSPSHHLSPLLFLISTYNSFSNWSFLRFSPRFFPSVLSSWCNSVGIAWQAPQCSFPGHQRSIFGKATHLNSAKYLWRIPRYPGRASSFYGWGLLFKAD